MKIYLRKIDEQCINKQISYPKDILKEFLDGRGEKDIIVCEGKTSQHIENVALLLSTDPRFDNGIKRVLAAEGEYKPGDIMVMYKLKEKYLVELVKSYDQRHASFMALFAENDRHLLSNLDDSNDDNVLSSEKYLKFKCLLEWFTKQLNINNNLEAGTKTSGQGYKEGSAIRELYKAWRDYEAFTLDCNIISGYQSAFSKVNYINKTHTGINIRPVFNKITKKVTEYYIDLYDFENLDEESVKIISKQYSIDDLGLFDGVEPNASLKELFDNYLKIINKYAVKEETPIDYDNCERLTGGSNIILYGVPGAGKSWTIKNVYCTPGKEMERVVFHPDYTYSDFIGQILPKSVDGDVTYKFIPGPFTNIVRESYRHPMTEYILVVEEINRGNAPAIFGDIFQLLDRNKAGGSEYSITNGDIAKEVYGDENHPVSIPSNMSILCTMNTSDQNVFTLDTAFQRRWSMRLIENVFTKETPEDIEFAEHEVLDTKISWEDFCEVMNAQILEKNQNMTSSEDKRLGTHFVNLDDLVFDKQELDQMASDEERKQAALRNRRFPEKVIKYLWDDAFKFYRDEIFKGEFNSLEKVIREFTSKQNEERFNIFKDNIKAALDEIIKKSENK